MTEKKETKAAESRYSKDQLLDYTRYRDIASVVLEDGKTYTKAEAEKLIETYLKVRV